MTTQDIDALPTWWHRGKHKYDETELTADAVVHCVGIIIAFSVGGGTLAFASFVTARADEAAALAIYAGTMIAMLLASLLFNQCPVVPARRHFARMDQAAIFVFIAGTYTPILVLIGEGAGEWMLPTIWCIAGIGVALKLFVPDRFGRMAIILHLAMGWAGLIVAEEIATELHEMTIWFLVAGGVSYTIGIFFHVKEDMWFHNVLWHLAVVVGMTLHLLAIANCMVFSRL